jgi:UDP-N-acetylmuramate dehydrogenase
MGSGVTASEPSRSGPAPARLAALLGARLRRDVSLAPLTSWQVGGPADFFVVATSTQALVEIVAAAQRDGIPWLVLGRGSNVLVADAGVRGLVIRVQSDSSRIDAATGAVTADAGVRLASLAVATASSGLAGLEFGVGIPGSIGGAVVMNAGAQGGCIADTLASAVVLSPDGELVDMSRDSLALGYRTSRFRTTRREVVLAATFSLAHGDPAASLALIAEYRKRRRDTQPTDASAGSVFRNPPGASAGLLLDRAGLKGTRIGGVMVSPKHANFFVNVGGATSSDVVALIALARETVERVDGVRLETEVDFIGEWPDPQRVGGH